MMDWITLDVVLAIHDEQLAEYGGQTGIRDENALLSALARPRQREAYGDPPPDIADLAAAYAFGIAKGSHPFIDANKRTSCAVTEAFLNLNGYELTIDDAGLVEAWVALGTGSMSENEFAAWLRRYVVRVTL